MTKKKELQPITAKDFDKLAKQLARRGNPALLAVQLTKPKTEAAHAKLRKLNELRVDPKPPSIGYIMRILTQCGLPHSDRATGLNETITRKNGKYTLHVQPGVDTGVPYGIYPRLIMAYLTQQVQVTKNRRISLGRSLSAFMQELGITPSYGKRGTTKAMRDQMERLFGARIWIKESGKGYSKADNASVAKSWALWWHPKDDAGTQQQGDLFESSVTLSEEIFEEMLNHPVPFDMHIVAAIKDSSLAVDLYWWLGMRMSYMETETAISWTQLAQQIGADYEDPKEFARKVRKQLARIRAAWHGEGGGGLNYETIRGRLVLKPSSPTVPKLLPKE